MLCMSMMCNLGVLLNLYWASGSSSTPVLSRPAPDDSAQMWGTQFLTCWAFGCLLCAA